MLILKQPKKCEKIIKKPKKHFPYFHVSYAKQTCVDLPGQFLQSCSCSWRAGPSTGRPRSSRRPLNQPDLKESGTR